MFHNAKTTIKFVILPIFYKEQTNTADLIQLKYTYL